MYVTNKELCVLCVIVRVTHSKSVWSFSSVTGLKVKTFLYRPTTQAVSGVFADTRPADTNTVSGNSFCRVTKSHWLLKETAVMWHKNSSRSITVLSDHHHQSLSPDVNLKSEGFIKFLACKHPLTLFKTVGHLLGQPLHGSNAQFSAIVSVKGCWYSTLLISAKQHQKFTLL